MRPCGIASVVRGFSSIPTAPPWYEYAEYQGVSMICSRESVCDIVVKQQKEQVVFGKAADPVAGPNQSRRRQGSDYSALIDPSTRSD